MLYRLYTIPHPVRQFYINSIYFNFVSLEMVEHNAIEIGISNQGSTHRSVRAGAPM